MSEDWNEYRDSIQNPSELGGGMSDDNLESLWDVGSSSSSNMMSPDSFNIGAGFGAGLGGGFGMPNNNQPQEPKSEEEKIFELIVKTSKMVWKGISYFSVAFFKSWKSFTPVEWVRVGHLMMKQGVVALGIGGVLFLLSFYSPKLIFTSTLLPVTGTLILMVGSAIRFGSYSKAVEYMEENGDSDEDDFDSPEDNSSYMEQDEFSPDLSSSSDYSYEYSDDSDYSYSSDGYVSDDSDDPDAVDYGDDGYYIEDDDELVDISSGYSDFDVDPSVPVEDAISSLPELTPGMQNRAFLFEQYYKVMQSITPNFENMEELMEGSEVFNKYNEAVMEIAVRNSVDLGKSDLIMHKVRENKFLTQIVITANKSFNAQVFAQGLEQMEKLDSYGRVVNPEVFTTWAENGRETYINIVKGVSPKVTVKDIWTTKKDFFLDPSNEMPVALGITEFGEPIVYDAFNMETMVVVGKPRKGKSWVVESIFSQICMFNSPNKVQFYIGDTKDTGGSTWSYINVPHIRRREYSDDRVLSMLREVLEVEAPRRKAMFAKYQVDKIQKLHTKYPEVDMPYLYIVVDELTNFSYRMTDDVRKEFHSMLVRFATEMPFLGVRLILIPHRINNKEIPVSVTNNVNGKIIVAGEPKAIEDTLQAKPKEFPYSIGGMVGKMGVRMPEVNSGLPTYVKAAVLAEDEDIFREYYNFIAVIWNKLDPVKDSKPSYSVSKDSNSEETSIDELLETEDGLIDLF